MRSVPLFILALALVAIPLAPVGGARTCVGYSADSVDLGSGRECVNRSGLDDVPLCDVGFGAGCAYGVKLDVGAPVCGDDGSGYACVVTLLTGYDALGATCIELTYGADAPYEGEDAASTCESGGWFFEDLLDVTFRDIPAEGRDVTIEGILSVGAYNDGEIGTTGSTRWWTAGTVHLPGP